MRGLTPPPAGGAVPVWRRLATYRLRSLVLLFLVGLLASASVVGIATLRLSAEDALREGGTADVGGRAYVVQTGDMEVRRDMSRITHLSPVRDDSGTASAAESETPVQIRTTRDLIPLGVLVAGRRARQSSEATISRAVSDDLGIGLGSFLQLRGNSPETSSHQVVGITANPANVEDRSVVRVDRSLDAAGSTVWLSRSDPYLIESLRSDLDRRAATMRSTEGLVYGAEKNLPSEVSSTRHAPLGLFVLMAILVLAVGAAFRRPAGDDVRQLVGAGMSPQQAWRTVVSLAVCSLIAGEISGAVGSLATVYLARTGISELFGQDWQSVAVPWSVAVGIVVATVAASILARPLIDLAGKVRTRVSRPRARLGRGPRVSDLVAIAGLVLLAIAIAARTQSPPGHLASWGPVAVLGVAVLAPRFVQRVSLVGVHPATKAIVAHLNRRFLGVLVAAAVLAVAVGGYSAQATHDSHAFESMSGAPQPRGSLLITEIPTAAADGVAAEFRRQGGRKVLQFDLPHERGRQVRVTGTKLLRCMVKANTYNPDSVPDECFPQRTYSPVNRIALGVVSSSDAIADRGLVEDGYVGLMVYTTLTSTITKIVETRARADQRLGGNMPGLVVPPDGNVARALQLSASGSRLVALLDFVELPARSQARMRGLISRVGPAAQVADATEGASYAADRSFANLVAVVGAVMVALMLLVGGSAVIAGERQTRRTLIDIGSSGRERRKLATRWAFEPALLALSVIPLSMLGVAVGRVNLDGGTGYLWLLPFVSMAMCSFVLLGLFMRVDPRVGE